MILLRLTAVVIHLPIEHRWPRGILERASILRHLERLPGGQLVIVRYSASHDPNAEWVYNEADIEAAKVIWARDMGKEDNRELLEYFRGRNAWVVEGDGPVFQAVPYSD